MSAAPKVLIVDDDPDLLALMAETLDLEGYRVESAVNGARALDNVSRGMPDLILLDMKMPVMDGKEFTRRFREAHDHQAPIVLVTAAADAGRSAAEIGVNGWLGKPFDLDALLDVVAREVQVAQNDDANRP